MSQVKTAISIDSGIFKMINYLAKKAHISRSHLFETAAREWVKKETAKDITARINRAVGNDHASADEARQAKWMRQHQRKLMDGQW